MKVKTKGKSLNDQSAMLPSGKCLKVMPIKRMIKPDVTIKIITKDKITKHENFIQDNTPIISRDMIWEKTHSGMSWRIGYSEEEYSVYDIYKLERPYIQINSMDYAPNQEKPGIGIVINVEKLVPYIIRDGKMASFSMSILNNYSPYVNNDAKKVISTFFALSRLLSWMDFPFEHFVGQEFEIPEVPRRFKKINGYYTKSGKYVDTYYRTM